MHKPYIFLSIPILASFLTSCAGNAVAQANEVMPQSVPEKVEPMATPEVVSKNPPASCPVTFPQDPAFVPPEPYSPISPFPGYFWYGTNSLWTLVPVDGVWADCPASTATDKKCSGGVRDTSGMKNPSPKLR